MVMGMGMGMGILKRPRKKVGLKDCLGVNRIH
jgi:hypothetical protein